MPQEILASGLARMIILHYSDIFGPSWICALSARNSLGTRVASQCMRPSLAGRSHLLHSSTGGPLSEPPTRRLNGELLKRNSSGNK